MSWISVYERKPTIDSEVVVLYTSGSTTVARFDGELFSEDGLLVERISHWFELPRKPTERFAYNYEDLVDAV